MKNRSLLMVLLIVCLVSPGTSQSSTKNEVVVSSWKKGDETITEQILEIRLTPENPSYEEDIRSCSGKVYRLLVLPKKRSLKGEHWKVELREVILDERKDKINLDDDLLYAERPGSIGDNFPREDLVAFFYPNSQNNILINNVPWIEGVLPLYPVNVTRKIQVEQFLVILRGGEIRFSEMNKEKIDLFQIFVEFANHCDRRK